MSKERIKQDRPYDIQVTHFGLYLYFLFSFFFFLFLVFIFFYF